MKKVLSVVLLGFALSMGVAHAAENSQQTKMASCNKEATGKTGDERKAFMSSCLSAKPAAAPKAKSKLGQCSADAKAKGLKGDARNKFLSECNKA